MIDAELEPLHPIEGYFTDVATALRRPPAWVVEGMLPEGLVFMAGPPKESFKSTITCGLAALIAGFKCQAMPADWQPKLPGPVMMFSHEADAGELRFILEEGLGVKLKPTEGILVCNQPWDYRLDDEDGLAQMLHWLNLRKPALCIIDPLANFHSIEEKDAANMIRIIGPIRRWAKDNGACVLIVHHTRKVEEGKAYKAADMRGTSALFGLCDGIIMLTPAPKAQYTVQMEATFKRGEGWTKVLSFAIWSAKGQRAGEQLRPMDEQILKAIRHGYETPDEVARHLAIAEGQVAGRLKRLAESGYVRKAGGKYTTKEAGK